MNTTTVYCVGFENDRACGFDWYQTLSEAQQRFARVRDLQDDDPGAVYLWEEIVPRGNDRSITEFICDDGEYVTRFDMESTLRAGKDFRPHKAEKAPPKTDHLLPKRKHYQSKPLVSKTAAEKELHSLRVSAARVAQVLGVGEDFLGSDPSFGDLNKLAETQERGWNDLCYRMIERIALLRSECQHTLASIGREYSIDFTKPMPFVEMKSASDKAMDNPHHGHMPDPDDGAFLPG